MRTSFFRIAAAAALAIGLWVVPSAGTQGQGTLGDRFVHADRALVGGSDDARAALRTGDSEAAAAVAHF